MDSADQSGEDEEEEEKSDKPRRFAPRLEEAAAEFSSLLQGEDLASMMGDGSDLIRTRRTRQRRSLPMCLYWYSQTSRISSVPVSLMT